MRSQKIDISKVYQILKSETRNYKVPVVDLIEMQTKDPFKVLVTTILSARTKDEVTLKAAERLFSKVRNLDDLESLSLEEIEKLIYPTGFYKTKAKHLKQLPKEIKGLFLGNIPQDVDSLTKLPGVGRKTANLVVAVAFNKPAICVDTHVHRIMNRIGYVKTETPLQTEMELRRKLPKKYWTTINSVLVAFGQNTCKPVKPKCSDCPVKEYCDHFKRLKNK